MGTAVRPGASHGHRDAVGESLAIIRDSDTYVYTILRMKCIPVFLLGAAGMFAADFTTGQAARLVIGQQTFTSQDSNSSDSVLGGASGLAYAAALMHVPAHWIVPGAIVLLGLGIVSGVKTTRQKDSAN